VNVTDYPSFHRLPQAEQARQIEISRKRSEAAKVRWRKRLAPHDGTYRDERGRCWIVLKLSGGAA